MWNVRAVKSKTVYTKVPTVFALTVHALNLMVGWGEWGGGSIAEETSAAVRSVLLSGVVLRGVYSTGNFRSCHPRVQNRPSHNSAQATGTLQSEPEHNFRHTIPAQTAHEQHAHTLQIIVWKQRTSKSRIAATFTFWLFTFQSFHNEVKYAALTTDLYLFTCTLGPSLAQFFNRWHKVPFSTRTEWIIEQATPSQPCIIVLFCTPANSQTGSLKGLAFSGQVFTNR